MPVSVLYSPRLKKRYLKLSFKTQMDTGKNYFPEIPRNNIPLSSGTCSEVETWSTLVTNCLTRLWKCCQLM